MLVLLRLNVTPINFMAMPGSTMADAVRPSGQTVEIKDKIYVSDSPQLRRQSRISAKKKQTAQVITGTRTRVSSTVDRRMKIRRRPDIGPQD